MKKYLNSVVAKFDTTQSGNAATGTTITVRDSSTGLRASLFSDNGVAALSNPFTVDSNGNYEFYVADGRYNIIQDENLPTQLTLADVSIFDVSVSFGAPKTVTALTNNIFNFGVGSSLTVSGYASEGDGGQSVWVKTADTDTAGQLPTVRQDGTLTDLRGAVWRIVPAGELDPRAVGFTGSDNETASLTAALNAVGDGGKVTLDKSYEFTLNNLESTVGAEIDFANSSVTSLTTQAGIKFYGEFTNQTDVSSVSGNTIVVSSTSGYLISDVVKITSTDEQADVWVSGRFLGQFAVITNIVGTTITLDRDIYDDTLYQNNVKLYKLPKKTASVKNLNIKPDLALSDHLALVEFESLHNPSMENVHTTGSRDSNLRFISCFGYTCKDCSSKNSLNNPGTSNYGYGTEDASCDGGEIENYRFSNGRHAFTNNSFAVGSSLDPRCGYTTNLTVKNGKAFAAGSGAWDTHPGVIGARFIDCYAESSLCFGQVRSRDIHYINPLGKNLTTGFLATTGNDTSSVNPVKGFVIENPDIECDEAFIAYYPNTAISRSDVGNIKVEGGKVKCKDGNYRGFILECRSAPIEIDFRNCSVQVEGISTDAGFLISDYSGFDVFLSGLRISATAGTPSGFSVVKALTAMTGSYTVKVEGLTLDGSGFANDAVAVVERANAYINDSKVQDLGGTGTLVDVRSGTRLTWGGQV